LHMNKALRFGQQLHRVRRSALQNMLMDTTWNVSCKSFAIKGDFPRKIL
jgi:hypothetical protein